MLKSGFSFDPAKYSAITVMVILKDEELVNMIKAGAATREKALHQIYSNTTVKGKLANMIANNSGNSHDAEDIYQEAIIVLDRNIREGHYRLDGSLSSYLYSTGKFLWMNHLRKKKLTLKENFQDSDLVSTSVQPDKIYMDEEKKKYLQSLLSRLGQRCQHIMELWQLSYSMDEIAKKLNIGDASIARKAKYDCQQQLIKLILSNPTNKEELE